jgi:nitroreductase
MTRSFTDTPVAANVIEACVALAAHSPSAGKVQGWQLVGLLGRDTTIYWDAALPHPSRENFGFPRLLAAPFVGVVLADPAAYVERYSEPDKAHTGLGAGPGAWSTPYWTVDASMATMTFLLALHDRGLGALFFAVANEQRVRDALHIPESLQVIGAVAAGHRDIEGRAGRSASRPRRTGSEIVRWGSYS